MSSHGSRARTTFDYRRYRAFSWSWSWRRTIVFGIFGVVLGLWQGTANGLLLDDARLGLEAGLLAASVWLLIVSAGLRGSPARQPGVPAPISGDVTRCVRSRSAAMLLAVLSFDDGLCERELP
ncbi:MAG: hypothetical protein ACRETB_13800 [Steroidobacteraceae bacterium]